jgi:hypothetical protein
MGFETLYLYREVELDVSLVAASTLTISTELSQFEKVLAVTSGRVPVNVRLTGDVRGKLPKFKLAPTGVCILYGARVWAKALGVESTWRWYALPVVETPEGYASAPLPIVPTPEGFSDAPLPIVPTPEGFSDAALPIVPTPEGWERMALPLRETPLEPGWVDLPLDTIE